MTKIHLAITVLILSLLVGCSSAAAVNDEKTRSYAKSHQLVGQASWYGQKFHGKLTASGERYNMRAYTAAHKTLPFGTVVRVTNTANNKSVDVKINDRGPYAKGRVIDLSQKSFEQIGSVKNGVAPVTIEVIDDSNTFRYKH
jgi:rare lipoprotein A